MVISVESQKQLGQYLSINGKDQLANIYTKSLDPRQFAASPAIEILTQVAEPTLQKTEKSGMIIGSPGEFEKDGMFVFALDSTANGLIDLVEIESEGIRVLYYTATEEINRDVLNQIGVIDVLVLQVEANYTKQLKTISIIDPQVLIPVFTNGVDVEKFKPEIGVKFEEMAKYKCKASDFDNEEYMLHGVLLTAS